MFEDHESSRVFRADHEWIKTSVRHAAPVLTADVDEDGSRAVPILVTDPVPLIILTIVKEVEMVNLVLESLLLESIQVN